MTTPIDTAQLIAGMKDAATQVLNKDVTTLRGFSERQIKAIAQQSELVAIGIASGQITEETREFFLDGIEDMALNFAKTLRGLLMVTIEKVWNAIVGIIWKAIETATGLNLTGSDAGS
ncbi:hypothetical protein [Halomonas sp. KO116]|uniref:hypothetical protein n=1 Tax=Halomonas sp. KO116 TaxID=1504981 RepID=UPI0004E43FE4|nr:hypothetical protein [Halomonas sp. KO116]AJY50440.1 hypothetical protein KO116_01961 [Halomonas sp. KO116]